MRCWLAISAGWRVRAGIESKLYHSDPESIYEKYVESMVANSPHACAALAVVTCERVHLTLELSDLACRYTPASGGGGWGDSDDEEPLL